MSIKERYTIMFPQDLVTLSLRMKNYNILIHYIKDFGLIDKVVELNGTYNEHFNIVKDYINSLYK